MGALTKAELAEHLHSELALSKREAKAMVEAFSKRFALVYVKTSK